METDKVNNDMPGLKLVGCGISDEIARFMATNGRISYVTYASSPLNAIESYVNFLEGRNEALLQKIAVLEMGK